MLSILLAAAMLGQTPVTVGSDLPAGTRMRVNFYDERGNYLYSRSTTAGTSFRPPPGYAFLNADGPPAPAPAPRPVPHVVVPPNPYESKAAELETELEKTRKRVRELERKINSMPPVPAPAPEFRFQ